MKNITKKVSTFKNPEQGILVSPVIPISRFAMGDKWKKGRALLKNVKDGEVLTKEILESCLGNVEIVRSANNKHYAIFNTTNTEEAIQISEGLAKGGVYTEAYKDIDYDTFSRAYSAESIKDIFRFHDSIPHIFMCPTFINMLHVCAGPWPRPPGL